MTIKKKRYPDGDCSRSSWTEKANPHPELDYFQSHRWDQAYAVSERMSQAALAEYPLTSLIVSVRRGVKYQVNTHSQTSSVVSGQYFLKLLQSFPFLNSLPGPDLSDPGSRMRKGVNDLLLDCYCCHRDKKKKNGCRQGT